MREICRRSTRRLAAAFVLIASAAIAPAFIASCYAEDAVVATKIGTMEGVLISNDPDKGKLTLDLPVPFSEKTLIVADPAAREMLAEARKGDVIKVTVDDATNPTQLTKLQAIYRPVDLVPRFLVVLVSLAVILGLAAGMLGKNPLAFLIGVDNRYSNSQTQLALWFSAVATFYLAAVLLRWFNLGGDYIGGVGITQNLVALTGLSALSFGSAKVITVQKIENAKTQPQANPKPSANQPKLTDLVQNDFQQADLGDFQMILITLGAVAVFIISAFHFLGELELAKQVTLPDVDSTLLASFGIGQGAYLIKKAAVGPGAG